MSAKAWTQLLSDNVYEATNGLESPEYKLADVFLDCDIAGVIFTYIAASSESMEPSTTHAFLTNFGLKPCEIINFMSLRVNAQIVKIIRMTVQIVTNSPDAKQKNLDILYHFDRQTDLFDNEITNTLAENGLDFNLNATKGVDHNLMFRRLVELEVIYDKEKRYFMYRGCFTITSIMAKLWGDKDMPRNTKEFEYALRKCLPEVYDLKVILFCLRGALRGNPYFGTELKRLDSTSLGFALANCTISDDISDVYECFFPDQIKTKQDILGESLMLVDIVRELTTWFNENEINFDTFIFNHFRGLVWGISCAEELYAN